LPPEENGDNEVEGEASGEVEQVASGRDSPGADEGRKSPMEGSAGKSGPGEEDKWEEEVDWGEDHLESQEAARKKKRCESKKEKKKKKKRALKNH
jgi:hypothetical protein